MESEEREKLVRRAGTGVRTGEWRRKIKRHTVRRRRSRKGRGPV